ncbi:endonuclease/Exonuclease/phosphatase [Xylariales sp. AK1849]|nr:endonuclease/Exonuclease/phosphatase [Xylariales sp. AK1849]
MMSEATATGGQPPMLDLFYLTFNAGKHLISVPIFGNHLYNAFRENATTLPELVVFSLQEMAPLSSAFVGGYFLNQYFSRFESALNLAAAKFVAEEDRLYSVVKTCNVGMTGIMIFAKDPAVLSNIQSAEVGFGAGDMANKGAVGLRMMYTKGTKETELTFVSTHLEAMEWNLERRNRNWESIMRGLVFADPRKIAGADQAAHARGSGEAQPLLFHPDTEKALHDISIYKPGSHLFVAGDLNYRLSETTPPQDAIFPVMEADSVDYYPRFLTRDQLTAERTAGRTLHGLSEAPIHFPPTYKYNILSKDKPQTELGRIGAEEDEHEDVKWKFARHRWPGWCDRVLYLDIPPWVQGKTTKIHVTAYKCLPVVRSSDHRAVFLRVQVPVIAPAELMPRADTHALEVHGAVHPHIKLPASIKIESWEHRAAVKRWEYMIGWSMMVSQSKQGIMVFATVLLVGIGAWWYGRGSWSS